MSLIKQCITSRFQNGKIIEVDYSQLEVVVLALLSKDPVLCKQLNDGLDMHSVSASFLTGESYDNVVLHVAAEDPYWVGVRKKAKSCSFLIQFGGGANTLSKNTGVTQSQAKLFIDNYYNTYRGVKNWQDGIKREVMLHQTIVGTDTVGHYTNPFGTKFAFKKKVPPWGGDANYVPTEMKNYPIQGTAADIVKIALGLLPQVLHNIFGDRILLINTVHDSFIFDINIDKFDDDELENLGFSLDYICTTQVEEIITNTLGFDMPVKLSVDIEIGDSWDNMESYDGYVTTRTN